MKKLILTTFTSITLSLVACSNDGDDDKKVAQKIEGRWYTSLQITEGKKVFGDNCAACHGSEGQGLTENWKKSLPDDSYPPPPLNGTAHTWHHSKQQLLRTINSGGIPLGGVMPAFEDKLTEKEKEAVMAYFMSLWPDRIYDAWNQRNSQ
ncbi:MAG: c-type cytochrome [Cocleimonas sp.]